MISLLRGVRGAIQALTFPKSEDCSLSSIDPMGTSASEAETQAKAIATLQVHGQGSREELDIEGPFYELTDVDLAMRHVGAIPPGRYAVFRDTSGRILLQARGLSPWLRANSDHRRKASRL